MNFFKFRFFTQLRVAVVALGLLPVFGHGQESACPKPKQANDVLKCLQIKHPEVLSEKTAHEVSEGLARQGAAWKNPDVSLESLRGKNLGSTVVTTEVRISQAIEVSGKRSARKSIGEALGDSFKAESLSKLEEVTLNGIKSLYRLTQLNDEIAKTEESVQRFKTIKNQYQQRPKLNPEQELTSGLVQLAVSEFEIKLNHLQTEKKTILADLSASTTLSTALIEKNLPSIKTSWPETPKIEGGIQSSSILKSKAQVSLAEGELKEAQAQAWPEFTVSLIGTDNIDGSLQYQTYGAGISMPLPLFQRNEGEKSLKTSQYSKALKVHARNTEKQQSDLKNLIQLYEASVKNLKNTPSNQSVETKHKKAESLFARGLIAGPLIIETHRQLLEYTQSRNEEELKALESLWTLYILNGTFLNQTL